jgi:hypothetical protein
MVVVRLGAVTGVEQPGHRLRMPALSAVERRVLPQPEHENRRMPSVGSSAGAEVLISIWQVPHRIVFPTT